jgi:hypothetical protein
MEGDKADLIELFKTTKGPNLTLKERLDSVTLSGPVKKYQIDQNSSHGNITREEEIRSPTRGKIRSVVFVGPPEMISSADEARAFNLRFLGEHVLTALTV